PAVALYQKIGFHIVRRLYGYTANPFAGETADLPPVDLPEIGKQVALADTIDLPWQVSGAAFMRWGSPMRGVRLDKAYAAFNTANGTLALRGLFVDPADRGQRHGTRLIRALAAAYPDHKWIVPQLSPEEFDGFFTRLGFERLPLNQVQMACALGTP
ncbi:MAG: GNAT family N-acetyltransferase, partial [Anaerolinea sp.]|nr:GNAT family N-acetyltransferase [Anaerolinea sp.]